MQNSMGITELLAVYLVWNLTAFCMVGYDKWRAQRKAWRVRESNFFLMALFFGAAGILVGMYMFHHKTRHRSFVLSIPVLLVINFIALYLLFKLNFILEG